MPLQPGSEISPLNVHRPQKERARVLFPEHALFLVLARPREEHFALEAHLSEELGLPLLAAAMRALECEYAPACVHLVGEFALVEVSDDYLFALSIETGESARSPFGEQ